jgi:hypothetical protein
VFRPTQILGFVIIYLNQNSERKHAVNQQTLNFQKVRGGLGHFLHSIQIFQNFFGALCECLKNALTPSHGHETGNDLTITLLVAPNAPYFIILLCLMPDDFTCQGESAATQWVNLPMHLVHLLMHPYFIVLLCLMPDDFICQMGSADIQWLTIMRKRSPLDK